jgi:hypothetical protein
MIGYFANITKTNNHRSPQAIGSNTKKTATYGVEIPVPWTGTDYWRSQSR